MKHTNKLFNIAELFKDSNNDIKVILLQDFATRPSFLHH